MNFTISFISIIFGLILNGEFISVKGNATYYASRFEGKRTTSGEVYRHSKFTAAHKTLPFGTVVKVCNLENGKEVSVIINDRGPYGKGMLIDLSQRAAKEIGLYGKGVIKVEVTYEIN